MKCQTEEHPHSRTTSTIGKPGSALCRADAPLGGMPRCVNPNQIGAPEPQRRRRAMMAEGGEARCLLVMLEHAAHCQYYDLVEGVCLFGL